jgi:hypothetical protein
MKRIITYFDFLGKAPEFYINRNKRENNFFGGILSLVTITCILGVIFQFGMQFLKKTQSTIMFNSLPTKNVALNYSNMPWMIILSDVNFNPFPNAQKYWYIVPQMRVFTVNNSSNSVSVRAVTEPVQVEFCDINKHFGKFKDMFMSIPYISNHWCPVPNVNNLNLYGIYGELMNYTFLNIYVAKCTNHSDYNRTDCYPIEKINNDLINSYVTFKYIQYSIDNNDAENPLKPYVKADTMPVSSTVYKRNWYYQRTLNYSADIGWVFEDFRYSSFYITQPFQETVDLRPSGVVEGSFVCVTLLMDGVTDAYTRIFSKVQNLIANTGGILKGLHYLSILFYSFWSEKFYFLSIGNNVFVINEGNRNKNEKIVLGNNYPTSNIKTKYNKEQILSLNTTTKIFNDKEKKKQSKPLDLGFKDYFSFPFCFKKKNSKLDIYYLTKNYLKSKLDLCLVIKKTIEIETMQKFIFNSHKLQEFEQIKKITVEQIQENHYECVLSKSSNYKSTNGTQIQPVAKHLSIFK